MTKKMSAEDLWLEHIAECRDCQPDNPCSAEEDLWFQVQQAAAARQVGQEGRGYAS